MSASNQFLQETGLDLWDPVLSLRAASEKLQASQGTFWKSPVRSLEVLSPNSSRVFWFFKKISILSLGNKIVIESLNKVKLQFYLPKKKKGKTPMKVKSNNIMGKHRKGKYQTTLQPDEILFLTFEEMSIFIF